MHGPVLSLHTPLPLPPVDGLFLPFLPAFLLPFGPFKSQNLLQQSLLLLQGWVLLVQLGETAWHFRLMHSNPSQHVALEEEFDP